MILNTSPLSCNDPRPSQNFQGRIAEGQFCVEGGEIVLYDMSGQRIAREHIPKDFTPRQAAARLLKQRESSKRSDFDRKLVYPRYYY
jgi:hypothetical protein